MGHRRHQVIIVGAGFGGLAAAHGLDHLPVDITVIDARNHHTFQPLLYQVATAGLDADDVCYPTRGIFHRQRNARVRLGRVTGVDLDHRTVELEDGERLEYDHLVLAVGAVTADFGIPGVVDHALGLKSAADALAVRTHLLRNVEAADARPNQIEDGALTMVVVGGGPTGVELAGGLAELVHHVLKRDFPALDLGRARIVLVEAADRVLSSFAPRLSDDARRALEKMGVELVLGAAVERVEPDRVELVGRPAIPSQLVIWAAGVRAHPLAESLGVELGPAGRIVVDANLSIPDHPEVFVVGDLAASTDPESGRPRPQVAPVAIQGGRHVADEIARQLHDEAAEPFHYVDKGSMATIGRHAAVVELPSGRTFSGPVGWLAWLVLHLVMLIGFRNRANVLVNWAWNYLTYDRASRLIVAPETDQERLAPIRD